MNKISDVQPLKVVGRGNEKIPPVKRDFSRLGPFDQGSYRSIKPPWFDWPIRSLMSRIK